MVESWLHLNPISPGLFGGLITRGWGGGDWYKDSFRNTYSLKLKLGQSDTQSMLNGIKINPYAVCYHAECEPSCALPFEIRKKDFINNYAINYIYHCLCLYYTLKYNYNAL